MGGHEVVIEGEDLQPLLREMEESGLVRVLGPHISRYYPGAGINGSRMSVKVTSDTPQEARELIWRFLPDDGDYTVRMAAPER